MKKIIFYVILLGIYILATIPIGLLLYTVKTNNNINVFSNTGFHAYSQCLDNEFKKVVGKNEGSVLQLTKDSLDINNFNYDSYINFYERIGVLIHIYKSAKNKKEIESILIKDGVNVKDSKWIQKFPEYLKYEKEFFDLQKEAKFLYLYSRKGTLAYPQPWLTYVFYDAEENVIGMYYENYDVAEMLKFLRDIDNN